MLGKLKMLEWIGGHYAEIVGTLALIVTTANLFLSVSRLRKDARRSARLGPPRRADSDEGLPRPDEAVAAMQDRL